MNDCLYLAICVVYIPFPKKSASEHPMMGLCWKCFIESRIAYAARRIWDVRDTPRIRVYDVLFGLSDECEAGNGDYGNSSKRATLRVSCIYSVCRSW